MGRQALFILTVVLALTIALGNAKSIRTRRQSIPPEFQNVKIENYLKNRRAMQFQLKCLTDEGPCDRIGKYIKAAIPELLTTKCKNCEKVNQDYAAKIVGYIQQNYKKEWAAVLNKYRGQVTEEEIQKFEANYGISITDLKINGSDVTAPVTIDELKGIFNEFKAHPPKIELNKPLPWEKDPAANQTAQNKSTAATEIQTNVAKEVGTTQAPAQASAPSAASAPASAPAPPAASAPATASTSETAAAPDTSAAPTADSGSTPAEASPPAAA